MHTNNNTPILLFDGVCNLCNGSVQWVLKRDRDKQFRFAALQSETGQQLLKQFGMAQEGFDTVVLVDNNQVFTRSDAALEILGRLGWPWALLSVLRWVPRRIRNAVYNWIGQNRYRWFGRQQECWLPRPEWKERFL